MHEKNTNRFLDGFLRIMNLNDEPVEEKNNNSIKRIKKTLVEIILILIIVAFISIMSIIIWFAGCEIYIQGYNSGYNEGYNLGYNKGYEEAYNLKIDE